MANERELRVGIAGLGTVGMGVLNLLETNADVIQARTGVRIVPVAVSARNRDKDRGMDLSDIHWCDDAQKLANLNTVDVVIEMIGGEDGLALELVQSALKSGKSVVTANKALLAHHAQDLVNLAEKNNAVLAFEAAVAGGIPAVKTIREGLAANQLEAVYGILNGTCNYVLTTMRETGRSFDDVLLEAQELGYAEAEPSLDVDGWDAAHKLALMASLAFGTKVDFESVDVEGIRKITASDIQITEELGYRIKLIGMARQHQDLSIEQYVRPVLVAKTSPIASVDGVFNAVVGKGNCVDQVMSVGRGAGAGPTASAVVADLIDMARGARFSTLGVEASRLKVSTSTDLGSIERAVYMSLEVKNEPGVLAQVTSLLGKQSVSIASCLQRDDLGEEIVSLILTTHKAKLSDIRAAMADIDQLAASQAPVKMMMIEEI